MMFGHLMIRMFNFSFLEYYAPAGLEFIVWFWWKKAYGLFSGVEEDINRATERNYCND